LARGWIESSWGILVSSRVQSGWDHWNETGGVAVFTVVSMGWYAVRLLSHSIHGGISGSQKQTCAADLTAELSHQSRVRFPTAGATSPRFRKRVFLLTYRSLKKKRQQTVYSRIRRNLSSRCCHSPAVPATTCSTTESGILVAVFDDPRLPLALSGIRI
jgi:hypothetical protein